MWRGGGGGRVDQRAYIRLGGSPGVMGRYVTPVTAICSGDVTAMWRRCDGDVTAMWRRCGGDVGGDRSLHRVHTGVHYLTASRHQRHHQR